jgi:hypothetical protein
MSDENDKLMVKVTTYVSKKHYAKIEEMAKKYQLPISRMVAIAVDHEFVRGDAFEFDMSIPDEEYDDHTYAEEGGKILKYLQTQKEGLSLDLLILLRHDIGVPNRDTFLRAFGSCIGLDFIEKYTKERKFSKTMQFYHGWRLKGVTRGKRGAK